MSITHRPTTGTEPVPAIGEPAPSTTRAAHPARAGHLSPRWRQRPGWEKGAVVALLVVTAGLYLWDLSSSGWANSFYSAAVQAGSTSWRAFLYGASDAAASITVDKPPASLWVMALSVRLFGLSSWSILVPQALMGVATVGVLYGSVRRRFSAGAALIAGTVLALTPVAALMFRFNNPDALLVLLLTLSVAAALRAIEGLRTTRWMVLAGALVGLAFLTKQLQAFLVLPGIALAFLWAAPVTIGRRIRDGLLAVLAMVIAGGWWVALVELVPESWRPYIGGSQDNSFLELTFGYNGLGRITGDETGSVGGGGGGWGSTGLGRLFGGEIGGQIAWLLPAALVVAVAVLWLLRRLPRTDSGRAMVVIWLGWLVITAVTFSFMAGIFHAYYTVALAPAVAALVGIGVAELWRHRRLGWVIPLVAAVTVGTGGWAWVLLGRSADWFGWLRWVVLATSVLAAAALLAGRALRPAHRGRILLRTGAGLALVAGLAGPTAYTLQTVSTGHTGSIVTAGPSVSTGSGGPGGAPGGNGGGPGGNGGGAPGAGSPGGNGGQNGGGQGTGGQNGGGTGGPGGSTSSNGTTDGTGMPSMPGGSAGGSTGGQGGAGGMSGLLGGTQVSDEVAELLLTDADEYTWAAATVGSQNAASYQLAIEESVMPIGGFNGSDPSPTLAEFQALVADGQIHYFIAGDSIGQSSSGSDTAGEITSWVEENYTAQEVDGTTVYDLSGD